MIAEPYWIVVSLVVLVEPMSAIHRVRFLPNIPTDEGPMKQGMTSKFMFPIAQYKSKVSKNLHEAIQVSDSIN